MNKELTVTITVPVELIEKVRNVMLSEAHHTISRAYGNAAATPLQEPVCAGCKAIAQSACYCSRVGSSDIDFYAPEEEQDDEEQADDVQ